MAQGFLSLELIIPMTNNHGYGSLEVLVGWKMSGGPILFTQSQATTWEHVNKWTRKSHVSDMKFHINE